MNPRNDSYFSRWVGWNHQPVFICLPDDCKPILCLPATVWLAAGCISLMILRSALAFRSNLFFCTAVFCWVVWPNHFVLVFFSFFTRYICREVLSLAGCRTDKWFCSGCKLAFARGVSSRMSWQNDFAICVLSFSFIDHPRGVFCWMPWLCHFAWRAFAFPCYCWHPCAAGTSPAQFIKVDTKGTAHHPP